MCYPPVSIGAQNLAGIYSNSTWVLTLAIAHRHRASCILFLFECCLPRVRLPTASVVPVRGSWFTAQRNLSGPRGSPSFCAASLDGSSTGAATPHPFGICDLLRLTPLWVHASLQLQSVSYHSLLRHNYSFLPRMYAHVSCVLAVLAARHHMCCSFKVRHSPVLLRHK